MMKSQEQLFNLERVQRDVRKKMGRVFVLSVFIIVGTFLFQIIMLSPMTRWVGATGDTQPWQLMEGLSGLASLALVLGGGVFAIFEYSRSEVDEARTAAEASFNLYQVIFDRLMSENETNARRWVLVNIPRYKEEQSFDEWIAQVRGIIFYRPPGHPDDQIPPGQAMVKQVLNSFDNLGFVAFNYWDMEGSLIDWMSPPIEKVWQRLGPYIEHESDRRGEPDYYIAARRFGDYCVDWRKDKPKPQFVDWAL